jgi:hypothetical protein
LKVFESLNFELKSFEYIQKNNSTGLPIHFSNLAQWPSPTQPSFVLNFLKLAQVTDLLTHHQPTRGVFLPPWTPSAAATLSWCRHAVHHPLLFHVEPEWQKWHAIHSSLFLLHQTDATSTPLPPFTPRN